MSEDLTHPERKLLAVSGVDNVHFLQGILTQDVSKLAKKKILFAALLSPQGKILHDMFLMQDGARIVIDTPTSTSAILLKRLKMYKLRAQVDIQDVSDSVSVFYSSSEGLADPRHASLPRRVYSTHTPANSISPETYRQRCLALGIPDSAYDFAPDEIVAADAGYDLLHAISYSKGCYVGQEVIARMHYKQIARKGFYILEANDAPARLALLKFDDVQRQNNTITMDNVTYHARLPEWLAPRFAQFSASLAAQS